jgi:type 1 glutamine amidotransferase
MQLKISSTPLLVGVCAASLAARTFVGVDAQSRAGGRGGGMLGALFTVFDTNKDGLLTRAELQGTFDTWIATHGSAGAITESQLAEALDAVMPAPPCGGRSANPHTPCASDVQEMMANLPASAPAKPAKPRKVLVLGVARGSVHSSIPLAARTVEELGKKTGAWATTISYDAADIDAANLKQYDAIVLDNTTGCFLDAPGNPTATTARRKALLEFVRGGKGLVAIHAGIDSYHGDSCDNGRSAAEERGERGRSSLMANALAAQIVSQGDMNHDRTLDKAELDGVASAWYAKLDSTNAGKISEAEFSQRFGSAVIAPMGRGGRGDATADPGGNPLWPAFNQMVDGYFKWHWTYPLRNGAINVKIDDPKSPLTAMFHGQEFQIDDETYTMNEQSFSRKRAHVLTSIDYAKMGAAQKKEEANPRADHFYPLSWIRQEGRGRVFVELHGHDEHVYTLPNMLQHYLSGIQYATGDLKADPTPGGTTAP